MSETEIAVRRDAVYFLRGTWPEVIMKPLPDGVFKDGQKYIVAVIPSPDVS